MDNNTIVGYPLNGVQYNAEDAQTYLCTRTSGIYSSEDNFRFGGIVDNRYVVIQPGLAWMKVSQFGGISFALKEAVQVYVEGGGDTNRTDLIVLRYDGNQNECSVACKKDSISVDRDNNIFELGLYKVFVEAGSTQIVGLGVDVQDVRLTELCGIMKDGVTGIPVNNLVEEFRAKVQNSIDTLNADAENALTNFETDAGAALEEFDNDSTSRFSDFSANANIKFTEFSQMSQRLESDARREIVELQQTSAEFDTAVNNANQSINDFNFTIVPNAMAQFETEKQEHFSAFVDEGDATILDFEERGNRALENFGDTVADVASGTDVMLQSAFNQSGKVGQVAFADELGLVVTGGFARKLFTGQENVFTVPFSTAQQKHELVENIRNNRSITIRLFSAKQAGESTSMDEWSAVTDFVNGNGGTHASAFDWSASCFDFRFQYADNVNGLSAAYAYFTCLFDNLKTAVLSISLSGVGGAGGTLTFI